MLLYQSMLHKDNAVGMGSLGPEGQMNMMSAGFGGPPSDNPWIAAASGSGTSVPLMPPNPPGPFGAPPGSTQTGPPSGNSGGDMVRCKLKLRNVIHEMKRNEQLCFDCRICVS